MKIQIISILFLLFLGGCQANSSNGVSPETITVSAAISLKDAFNEIGELYRSKTGKGINFNFGASGALQQQIETGAPVDVFASAAQRQMDELADKNLIDAATRRDFARNTLVLIVPKHSTLNLTAFSDLNRPEAMKIAVGNPKTVPAGQYTEQVFEKTGLNPTLKPKIIFAEHVRQVLDYVVRGETDAGVVYATDALVAGETIRVAATAPDDAHDPILYPIALVKDGRQKRTALAFVDVVLSDEGQNILQKYGFASASQK